MRHTKHSNLSIITGLLAAAAATGAHAQENTDAGVKLTFGVESSLRVNDNYDFEANPTETTTLWDNTLTFGVENITPIQRLNLNVTGILRYSNLPNEGGDVTLDDPDMSLRYARDGAMANFTADALIQRDQLNFTDPLRGVEDPTDTDLVVDDGERESRSIGFNVAFNTSGPFGLEFGARHSAIEYYDTTDARLFDSETNQVSVTARMRLSQTVESRLSFTTQEYTADDAVQTLRDTDTISAGLTYLIDPVWELDVSVGRKNIETTEQATTTVTETNDTTGSLRITRAFRTGTASLSFNRDATISGSRSTLRLSRSYETPTNMFNGSIGATRGPSGDTDLVASLGAKYTMRSSVLSANFAQSFATNTAGNDFRSTNAGINFSQELNATSRWLIGLNYAKTSDAGDGSIEEIETYDFKTSYMFDLTPDWGMEAGYIHRFRDAEVAGETDSNEVFFSIRRSFTYLP